MLSETPMMASLALVLKRELRGAVWAWPLAALLLVLGGCSSEDAPLANVGRGTSGSGSIPRTPCDPGAIRECSVTLSEHEGVLTCLHGQQVCTEGRWGECQGEGVSMMQSAWGPSGDGRRLHALGEPESCPAENPCDPFCWQYADERPEGGYRADQGDPILAWQGGDISRGGPGGLIARGNREPCTTASDCQFDQYCENPATGANCLHGKCEEGAALDPTCDPCVAEICAEDPSCCDAGLPPSECAHDPCANTGYPDPLRPTCDACVAAVCAATPSCCTEDWSDACAAAYRNCPGAVCPCPVGEIASLDRRTCYAADRTNQPYDGARAACQARGAGWDLISIGSAEENGIARQLSAASNQAWIGLTDRATEGRFVWESGDVIEAGDYASFGPNEPNNQNGDEDCVHIYSSGAWNDRNCGYNFAAICEGPSAVQNRWSASCVEQVGTVCGARCSAPTPNTCAHDPCAVGAALDPACHPCVDAVCEQMPSCCTGAWDAVCAAAVPSACGRSCPLGDSVPPPEDGQCIPYRPWEADYGCPTPDLTLGVPCSGTVPVCNRGSQVFSDRVHLVHFPANSSQYPTCDPGSHANMEHCYADVTIPVGECVSVACPSLTAGIREVMVNPPGPDQVEECSCRNNWALHWGQVSCVSPTVCEQAELSPPSCVYTLRNQHFVDPANHAVTFEPGAVPIEQVSGASACGTDGGWYYDDPVQPTRITLCPASCALHRSTYEHVLVELGCPHLVTPTTRTQVYEGECPDDTPPQWTLLTYDTSIPDDASVVFRVRTAVAEAELASAAYRELRVATQAEPDCTLTSPAGCPVDLFQALDGFPLARDRFLELEMRLNPTSNQVQSPVVHSWRITYSCPPSL